MLRNLEQAYLDRDKTESNRLIGDYVSHFLAQDPATGIEFEYNFAKAHLADISLADVNALSQKWIAPQNRVVIAQSTEKPAVKLPTEAELQAVIARAAAAPVGPYEEKQLATSLLAQKPAPGAITARKTVDAIGLTELTFANGVRVVLKPTTFKNDQVLFTRVPPPAASSVFGDDYVLAAQFAAPNIMGKAASAASPGPTFRKCSRARPSA